MSDEIPLDIYSQSLLGYLPATVIKKIIDDKNENLLKKLPHIYSIKTVSLFADISGFTKLSMSFAKLGRIGPEFLAFSLNRYMEQLIKIISKNGGDIFKFAGDALLVIWPEGNNLEESCKRAIQCSLEIQSELHNKEISPDKKLSIKIGLGVGDVRILFVGGVFSRSEYLIVGEAMRVACLSETLAIGGETIAHESIHNLISDFYQSEEIHSPNDHGYDTSNMKFYKIINQYSRIPVKSETYLLRSRFNANQVRDKIIVLKSYIPKAISNYLEIEKENWSKEIRLLTIMFLNIKIDLSHTQSQEGINKIQKIVEDIQRCIYLTKGSLNKFLMDDKGSVMLIVWGLPSTSALSSYDASRAVLSSIEIIKELTKYNCGAYIGITTGSCFTGVCGTVGGRREYSLLGEVVNLSARFMQQSIILGKENNSEYQILIDEKTKNIIERDIPCEWVLENECKGFAEKFQFYQPILDLNKYLEDPTYFLPNLRLHKNNYIFGNTNKQDENKNNRNQLTIYMVGRKDDIEAFKEEIFRAYKKKEKEILLVRGEYGSGKTLFIRKVLYEFVNSFKELITKINLPNDNNNPQFIFTSSLNPRTEIKEFNCLNFIFKSIIPYFIKYSSNKKKFNQKMGDEIIEFNCDIIGKILLESYCYSYSKYIEEILEINLNNHIEILSQNEKFNELYPIKEITPIDHFFERREYRGIEKPLINFFILLLKAYKLIFLKDTPLLLIIEDIQVIDSLSFNFLKEIKNENNLKELIIILSHKDYTINSTMVISEFSNKINEIVSPDKNYVMDNIIEPKEISKLISLNIPEFNSIVKEINSKFFEIILNKSFKGNPLFINDILNSIIENNLFKINENGVLEPSQELIDMNNLRDFSNFQVPMRIETTIGFLLDSLSTNEIIVLKYAAVIGNIFSLSLLYSMNEFNNLSFEDMNHLLQTFEAKGILEILYDLYPTHTVYKFAIPFCREVLYQRMLIEQKNEIHLNTVRNMQKMKFSYLSMDQEINELKKHLKLSEKNLIDYIKEDKNKIKDEINLNSLKMCFVKELQFIIKKQLKRVESTKNFVQLVFSSEMTKKSDKKITWERRFLGCSINKVYYWYFKEDYNNNKQPLGFFDIKNIYKVELIPESQGSNIYNLCINVSHWVKKDLLQGPRDFIWNSDKKEDLYKWLISLNFLKLNVIYDNFSLNFSLVTLPLFEIEAEEIKNFKKLKRKFQKHKYTETKSSIDISNIYNSIARKSFAMRKSKIYNDINFIGRRSLMAKLSNISGNQRNENNELEFEQKRKEFIKNNIHSLVSNGFINILSYIEDIIFNVEIIGKGYIHVPEHIIFLNNTNENENQIKDSIKLLQPQATYLLIKKDGKHYSINLSYLDEIKEEKSSFNITELTQDDEDENEISYICKELNK